MTILERRQTLKEKILIVEDNPLNMRLLEILLRPKSYTLLEAVDGEEALDIATRELPDLIVMDIQLPKMSGLEVTQRLRQMPVFSRIPIIALTAYAMKGDRERFIDAGCNAYLPKPINTRELPKMINQMLQQRQKDNTKVKDNDKKDSRRR
jgi:two-component system cell cycle response regulator DivK